jgi:hypothetical protein
MCISCWLWKKKSQTGDDDGAWSPPIEEDSEQEQSASVDDEPEPSGCSPLRCPTKNGCHLCQAHLKDTTEFQSLADGKKFQIQGSLGCRTPFVIYLVECCLHKVQYVGSSVNFYKRWSDHKKDIKRALDKKKKNKEVKISSTGLSAHFWQYHDEDPDEFLPVYVTLIDSAKNDKEMKMKEAYWINKVKTLRTPTGLNSQQAVSKNVLDALDVSFSVPV